MYGHQLTDDILQEKFKQRQTKFGKLSFLKAVNTIQTTFKKKISITSSPSYNYDVKIILDRAIKNAYRFKTPVITPEILFLTILEEKETTGGKLLKLLLDNDLNWNLLPKFLKNYITKKHKFKVIYLKIHVIMHIY